jgi:hypothetical protein
MAVTVQGGFGFTVKLHIGTATPWTTIASVLDGEFPEQEALVAESTGHDATSGYATWTKTGKRQLNPFTLTLAWDTDDTSQAALVTAFDSDISIALQVQDPDGDELIAISALVTKIGRESKQDGIVQCVVTFQPTGAPTIT